MLSGLLSRSVMRQMDAPRENVRLTSAAHASTAAPLVSLRQSTRENVGIEISLENVGLVSAPHAGFDAPLVAHSLSRLLEQKRLEAADILLCSTEPLQSQADA